MVYQISSWKLALLFLLAMISLHICVNYFLIHHYKDTDSSSKKLDTDISSMQRATTRSIKTITRLIDINRIFSSELTPLLVPRVPGTASHATVRNHIVSRLTELGTPWEITQHTFSDTTPFGNIEFTNIIATLNSRSERRLVLASHYDSKKIPVSGESTFLGATDSALPCALLLDLVHTLNTLLKNYTLNSKHTLQLIFFDGEEAFLQWSASDSLYGSRRLAEDFEAGTLLNTKLNQSALKAIEVFILLDLIGAPSTTFNQLASTTDLDIYSKFIEIEQTLRKKNIISKRAVPYFRNNLAYNTRKIEDDHKPFHERGVSVVHLISVPFPDVWHTLDDNLNALDKMTAEDLQKIFYIFVCNYFGILSV